MMDKWIDDYKRSNGLSGNYNNNTGNTQQYHRYENYSANNFTQQDNPKEMSLMDKWMDDYERRNGLIRSYNNNKNNYNNLKTSNLNYLGIPRRTWD